MAQTQQTNPCRRELLRRLAVNGGWMARAELQREIGHAEFIVDNELADLVVAEVVMFNVRAAEYRLGGSPLARQALKRLHLSGQQRVMLGKQHGQAYRVGMAQRVGSEGDTVMAELELPYPAGDVSAVLRLAKTLEGWVR